MILKERRILLISYVCDCHYLKKKLGNGMQHKKALLRTSCMALNICCRGAS
jgi:hypothetical protein